MTLLTYQTNSMRLQSPQLERVSERCDTSKGAERLQRDTIVFSGRTRRRIASVGSTGELTHTGTR